MLGSSPRQHTTDIFVFYVEIERGKMQEHDEDMVRQHLSQSAQAITNLQQEKQTMTEEIRQLKEINDKLTQEIGELHKKQETGVNAIRELKEEGKNQLENLQKATEQNFESLSLVEEQNTVFKNKLVHTQSSQATLEKLIHDLYAKCLLNKDGNTILVENEKKLEKMILVLRNKFSKDISNLAKEMDLKIADLRKKQEMDHTALLKHEAKSEETVSKLGEEISENRKKLAGVKEDLTVTQDKMNESFRHQCKQMQLDYDSLNDKITKKTQSRENDFISRSKETSELHSVINNGVHIWRISNINSALANTATKPLFGQPFYSDASGYNLQPKIFFNGARQKDNGHVAIFIQIRKGKFDPILKWPFAKRICFTLIEQESNGSRRGLEKILLPADDGEEIRRPSDDANKGFGIYKFASHEVLRAGRYIVDDVMFVKIELLDIEENKQSETL